MLIDLERSTLSFSVNGGEEYEAGIVLPSAVVPWCLLTYRGDAVTVPVARAVRDGMIWLMHDLYPAQPWQHEKEGRVRWVKYNRPYLMAKPCPGFNGFSGASSHHSDAVGSLLHHQRCCADVALGEPPDPDYFLSARP